VSAPTPNAELTVCGAVASNAPGACVLDAGHADRGERHQDAEGLTWSYDYKRGRPDVYEITWMSGHIEQVVAHQVCYPHRGIGFGQDVFGIPEEPGAPRVQIHAEINGEWRLVLSAREADIRTMRLVTGGERIPGDGPLAFHQGEA
jgi:hypothetical protein